MASNNNETVHISLGTTANHITSHLLNLQGLAATASSHQSNASSSSHFGGDEASSALCDPSVTHDISSLESSDVYSSGGSASKCMYVPRALIVDGRDSFGASWGGVARNANANAVMSQHQASSAANTWGGEVAMLDAASSDHDAGIIFGRQQQQQKQHLNERGEDPLDTFRNAASMMGLSPLHSRFNATSKTNTYNSGAGSDSRHMQWDDDDEEEEEEEDDGYCYGQNAERIQEETRRRLERMEYQQTEARRNWNASMGDAWEETFYGSRNHRKENDVVPEGVGGSNAPSGTSDNSNETTEKNAANNDESATTSNDKNNSNNAQSEIISSSVAEIEREIQWYDYWMPPRPSPAKYQIPLPFDSATPNDNSDNSNSTWSTSFNMGYHPGSGMGGNDSSGITKSWREHVLSESLRKVLEGCDVVKGFNVFVDGGTHRGGSTSTGTNHNGGTSKDKHAKRLAEVMSAGGGFHAGLAASLLEELGEECRSAGRWAVMADPLSLMDNAAGASDNGTIPNQVHRFRQCINAGLAMHGLSSNSDAFLPVSIEGAYDALRGGNGDIPASPNRVLFEGSAAVSLALEASTLLYRLDRDRQRQSSSSSHSGGGARRSRIGIQSGFYQGYGGQSGYDDGDGNEPFASAPSLTYHEFLACARPSSDRRRSILELDALVRPISFPSASTGAGSAMAGGGVNVASLLSGNAGGGASAAVLASLTASGLIGGNSAPMGELQKRMMRGTSIERMRMEQQRSQYRSSRSRGSSRQNDPGEWLEDISTKSFDGGGLLSSLSGNSTPFGRRSDHHHFALSTSLRPAASDARSFASGGNAMPGGGGGDGATSAFLRPMMESMGVTHRPEVSLGAVVKDTVVDLTGADSYWRSIFADRRSTSTTASSSTTKTASAEGGTVSNPSAQKQQRQNNLSPREIASHTPILSVLGNSTRSYPRLHSVSSGFVDALHSRQSMGYLSRDVMAGIVPEKDDCEEALEFCRELADVYEPPAGSGLLGMGDHENDDLDAYFDE